MKYTPKQLKGNVNVSQTSPIREFFLLLGALLGIILVIYVGFGFAVDLVIPRLPDEVERSLVEVFSGIYDDTEQTPASVQLQKLLDELLQEYPEKERFYRIHLVPDCLVNAMALPGGNIVVFSGLINEVESENELTFVLAHELGHFANRDHLRGLGRGLVLLTISTALLGADNVVNNLIMNSLVNVQMKFSQEQERKADFFGLDLLNRRYGHVGGATDFFQKMAAREKKGRLAYYFASHPYPLDRVENLKKEVQLKAYQEKETTLLGSELNSLRNNN